LLFPAVATSFEVKNIVEHAASRGLVSQLDIAGAVGAFVVNAVIGEVLLAAIRWSRRR
jgi:hypothetical protein